MSDRHGCGGSSPTRLEQHLAQGWEYGVDVLLEAGVQDVARELPGALGRLERVDARTTRLIGSTGHAVWYAQQLAAVPVPFRVGGGPELGACVRDVGARLVAAVDPDV